jgi:hypothetical protein
MTKAPKPLTLLLAALTATALIAGCASSHQANAQAPAPAKTRFPAPPTDFVPDQLPVSLPPVQKGPAPANLSTVVDVAVAGKSAADDLTIAGKQAASCVIVTTAKPGAYETMAANELAQYISMMTGQTLKVVTADSADLKSAKAQIYIGQAAIAAKPQLSARLTAAAKPNPTLRADAITLLRDGSSLYLAGNNDESHYFAVAYLLNQWGVRWYLPTQLGECVPEVGTLKVGKVDFSWGSPFESRQFWYSWLGDYTGHKEFTRRNFFNTVGVPNGHALNQYIGDIVPPGKSPMNIPISDPATAAHVAKKVAATYAKGEHVIMGMEDGTYTSDYKPDSDLAANLQGKYFQLKELTDPFMVFYNAVGNALLKEYPNSPSKIGFLAYSNITIPPQRKMTAAKNLVAYLAPIDIDPTHSMNDVRSPAKQEYRDMMYKWSQIMQGRVVIYDYDQGMLVWRDIPNPSIMAFTQDVKHYRDAGILGLNTESRNAVATIFNNIFFRGQLMWNPDVDVRELQSEFYTRFYGPAAAPMADFWNLSNQAWEDTLSTEHEFFVAPSVYTPAVVQAMGQHLAKAQAAVAPLKSKSSPSRLEKQYLERMKFAHLQYEVLSGYMSMVENGAAKGDYKAAADAGKKALKAREEMTAMNGTFTTTRLENGDAWFPGEVKLWESLASLTDGTKGRLVAQTPLEWAFRRDPWDTGYARGWGNAVPDLTFYNANIDKYGPKARMSQLPGDNTLYRSAVTRDYPTTQWEMLRTDVYPQAQGILHPDYQSFTGHLWYHTEVEISAADAGKNIHLMFPGLFCESWLYVNGSLVAHRPQGAIWWLNDYKFNWDIDLVANLKPGKNKIILRSNNTHHFGGIFRRPFLYQPTSQTPTPPAAK